MLKYAFDEQLIKGLIKSRPNRFIMMVEINGKVEKCHCPSTGRIGNIEFKDIPCLLPKSNNSARKTGYTVEAIIPDKKTIVGINQTKANSYMNFFFENNLLKKIINVKEIKREVRLNSSRIDFLLNQNCFLEVKTPLIHLPFGDKEPVSKFSSLERLGRHFNEISLQIKKGQRAVVVLCYLYDAERFKPPKRANPEITKLVDKATSRGLEYWQVNLKLDKKGLSLADYFKLKLS